MSKEPGQLAFEAYFPITSGWETYHDSYQSKWAAVEAVIRADERAKVWEEAAKVAETLRPDTHDPGQHGEEIAAAIRAKIGDGNG